MNREMKFDGQKQRAIVSVQTRRKKNIGLKTASEEMIQKLLYYRQVNRHGTARNELRYRPVMFFTFYLSIV